MYSDVYAKMDLEQKPVKREWRYIDRVQKAPLVTSSDRRWQIRLRLWTVPLQSSLISWEDISFLLPSASACPELYYHPNTSISFFLEQTAAHLTAQINYLCPIVDFFCLFMWSRIYTKTYSCIVVLKEYAFKSQKATPNCVHSVKVWLLLRVKVAKWIPGLRFC